MYYKNERDSRCGWVATEEWVAYVFWGSLVTCQSKTSLLSVPLPTFPGFLSILLHQPSDSKSGSLNFWQSWKNRLPGILEARS